MKRLILQPQYIAEVFEIYRRKTASTGIFSVAHAGVGFKLLDGSKWVLHRTPGNNTHISNYEDFLMGETPTIRELIVDDIADIIQRAEAIYGNSTQYSIFKNCEHLKNFVLFGKAESEQLKAGALGLGGGVALSVTALSKQPTWVKILATGICVAGAIHVQKRKQLGY